MSMIIESLRCERRFYLWCANSEAVPAGPGLCRRSALACAAGRRVPPQVAGAFACHRVQRAGRIAGALERFERLAAHRRIDVEIRHAADGAELLEHEKDDAVVDQAAPVAPADQVLFFLAQSGRL